jgi:ribosomal protein L22
MEVRAVGKYMRISPSKVRKLAGAVKGKAGRKWCRSTQIHAAKGRWNA